ncbi:metalloprotease TldD [Commensalibacter melissae]|uniref:metalloprotease TldD n=1 Tax=Commensalibacter melissae TaxID=2070537 RepID=UPI0012D859B7|nr:metalloprotease TldD [Commensalibacter melissae]MUG76943.1 metalloprotease TldD [Commensalibacter melissae]
MTDPINALTLTDSIFFNPQKTQLDRNKTEKSIHQTLSSMDDGELFLEYRESEMISIDDGTIRTATTDITSGFGLRSVLDTQTGFAFSNELSDKALKRASETVSQLKSDHESIISDKPVLTNHQLYHPDNPLHQGKFADRAHLLHEIDAYARSKSPHVVQVSASLSAEWQAIQIIRTSQFRVADIRPLVRLNVTIITEKNGRREIGSYGCGGRYGYDHITQENIWKNAVHEALHQSLINQESKSAPAGEMDVVLGSGWPGILLHEAIGHGLEGDFNRKGTSAFAGLMGKRIAAPGVNVVDDGTLSERRGSLNIDDEGTPTQRTNLIEDGILTGLLYDRLNARLMNKPSTGNGRRESFACAPIPRMTNTFMLAGKDTLDDMIKSTKKGLYAVNFGGGQVDITSGKFVFSTSEAYLIENGKVTHPVKGATLIGNGPDALTKITMIGNKVELDKGVGTCGKAGQGVPVGVGQPSLKLSGLTVGGTDF